MSIIRVTLEVNQNDWNQAATILESLAKKLRQPQKPPEGSTIFRDAKGRSIATINYYP